MNTLISKPPTGLTLKRHDQGGINMVDLMMWLVIAALLLAAAIQGIGYYQKAAYLYQMQSDIEGAGTIATGVAAKEDGVITKAVVDEALTEAKRSAEVNATVELASNGTTPYLRATHPGVTDKDALYLFDACGDTYKIGVNVVPKDGTVELEECGVTGSTPPAGDGSGGTPDGGSGDGGGGTTPVGDGGGSTPPPGGSANDIDGDGIPNTSDDDIDGDSDKNGTDPDIDGDGTPNNEDNTPNGDEGLFGGGVGGSTKCTGLSVEAEVACWHDELVSSQHTYEAANNHYWGIASYSNQPDYLYSPAEMAGTPLLYGARQETYRDSDPVWDYNYFDSAIVDRNGDFWRGAYFNSYNNEEESYGDPLEKSVENVNYACDFVTPADLNSLCTTVGIHQEKYVVTSANSNATAYADVEKVVAAQMSAVQSTGNLHGGYSTTFDATAWAGTTYNAKVWNIPVPAGQEAWNQNVYTRVMVTAPNGDVYTAQYRFWKSAASMADGPARVYKYSDAMVDRVCSRPFTNTYNQNSDIGTCSSLGYADFHP